MMPPRDAPGSSGRGVGGKRTSLSKKAGLQVHAAAASPIVVRAKGVGACWLLNAWLYYHVVTATLPIYLTQFPVSRITRYLRKGKYAARIGAAAPVFLAGVMEYLCAEVGHRNAPPPQLPALHIFCCRFGWVLCSLLQRASPCTHRYWSWQGLQHETAGSTASRHAISSWQCGTTRSWPSCGRV